MPLSLYSTGDRQRVPKLSRVQGARRGWGRRAGRRGGGRGCDSSQGGLRGGAAWAAPPSRCRAGAEASAAAGRAGRAMTPAARGCRRVAWCPARPPASAPSAPQKEVSARAPCAPRRTHRDMGGTQDRGPQGRGDQDGGDPEVGWETGTVERSGLPNPGG